MEVAMPLDYLFDKLCVPDKTSNVNIKVFDVKAGTNELKSLVKHISCARRCKSDGKKRW